MFVRREGDEVSTLLMPTVETLCSYGDGGAHG